jgi:hypothetical protein
MSAGVRSVLAFFGIYVLAVLLASTFPIGAGDAAHGGVLLHPIFPHVHNAAREGASLPPSHVSVGGAPAFDSSAGGANEVPVTALTPPLPRATLGLPVGPVQRLLTWDLPPPIGLLKPPPVPPPTSLA